MKLTRPRARLSANWLVAVSRKTGLPKTPNATELRHRCAHPSLASFRQLVSSRWPRTDRRSRKTPYRRGDFPRSRSRGCHPACWFEGQASCQPRERSPHLCLVVSALKPDLRPVLPLAGLVSNLEPPGQLTSANDGDGFAWVLAALLKQMIFQRF